VYKSWAARDVEGEDLRRHLLQAFLDHDEWLLSDTALVCGMMEMGIDRILFSVDYRFTENPPGTEWLRRCHLAPRTPRSC
jgi:2,3-dihydroxybenzoate decarboxylase